MPRNATPSMRGGVFMAAWLACALCTPLWGAAAAATGTAHTADALSAGAGAAPHGQAVPPLPHLTQPDALYASGHAHASAGHATTGHASSVTTRRTNWFDRVIESFTTSFFGTVLFFFTFAVLMGNEGHYVARMRVIDAVTRRLKARPGYHAKPPAANAPPPPLDAACATQDPHTQEWCRPPATAPPQPTMWDQQQHQPAPQEWTIPTGEAELHYDSGYIPGAPLSDPAFGVTAHALRLRRHVEMFQFFEERKETTEKDTIGGGETTTIITTLKTGWFDIRRDLSGDAPGSPTGGNPHFPVLGGESVVSRDFNGHPSLGGYTLSNAQVSSFSNWRDLQGTQPGVHSTGMSAYLEQQCSVYMNSGSQVPQPPVNYGTYDGVHQVYPTAGPKVGDVRVTWDVVLPGQFTVLCGRRGASLTDYVVSEVEPYELPCFCIPCTCCGLGSLLINAVTSSSNVVDCISEGALSPADMVKHLLHSLTTSVWVLRVGGFLMFALSLSMVMAPFPTILSLVGFIGTVASYGVAFVSIVAALILTPLTIAVCWVTYRPVIAVGIAAPALVLWYIARTM